MAIKILGCSDLPPRARQHPRQPCLEFALGWELGGRRLGPGDGFGGLALLRADARRTATLTSDEPLGVVTPDRHTFLTALAGTPD